MKKTSKFAFTTLAYFISSSFVCTLIIIQNTSTNLLWLLNNNFHITYEIILSTLLYDLQGSNLLYLIIFITLFLAFIIASIMKKLIPLNNSISYSLSGFLSLYVMIQITLKIFDNLFVISSVREWYGLFIFCLIGMLGGYIFNLLRELFLQRNI